jgi:hypothetical protein
MAYGSKGKGNAPAPFKKGAPGSTTKGVGATVGGKGGKKPMAKGKGSNARMTPKGK